MSDHPQASPREPLLQVEDLWVRFASPERTTSAVRGVSFSIGRGRTLALVGRSGSGKTVTAHAVLRLLPASARIERGRILLRSARAGVIDVAALHERSPELYRVRGGVAGLIFQEPASALSPVHTLGSQVAEAVAAHGASAAEARRRALAMLDRVGIGARLYDRHPHEVSGGMRQRVVIAMALVGEPELLIADEPTTALDASLQAQILALIGSLQREIGFSVLLITHDFAVVAQAADHVAVMEAGRVVESGSTRDVLRYPAHPYTRALLDALPARRLGEAREAVLAARSAS